MAYRILLLVLLLTGGLWAEEAYVFSLNGQQYRPRIYPVESSPGGAPAPGDMVGVSDFVVRLGAPGRYDYRLAKDRLYQGSRVIGVESEGFATLSPAELRSLECLVVDAWTPQQATFLKKADLTRLCVVVVGGTKLKTRLPDLPSGLRYFVLTEHMSPCLTDLSGLKRLKSLRFLVLDQLMTVRDLDAGWLAQNSDLRYLSARDLAHPERLAPLRKLRGLRLSWNVHLSDIGFVARLPALENLAIEHTPVRDLQPIGGHPALRILEADASAVDRLPDRAMPALRSLSLLGAPISEAAVTAFAALNPQCRVRHDWVAELKGALGGTDRLRIRSGGTCHRDVSAEQTLLELKDPAQVQELLGLIAVDEANSNGECMCCGNPSLEFYRGSELLLTLGFHHGKLLRWREWPADARLLGGSGEDLVDWLAARGVPGPKAEIEAERARRESFERAFSAATRGLPDPVKQALLAYDPIGESNQGKLRQALTAAFPSQEQQIDALLRVAGSPGPWNPSSMYEVSAMDELAGYPPAVLVPRLEAGLAGPDRRLARGSIRFWRQSDLPEVVAWKPDPERALTLMLESRHHPLRQDALMYLLSWAERMPADRVQHFLTRGLGDPDPGVRRQAMLNSGRLRATGSLPTLLKVLEGGQETVIELPPVPPEEEGVEPGAVQVGGDAEDWEIAALGIGIMGKVELLERLKARPMTRTTRVARALLGEGELLQPEHFGGRSAYELQLCAVGAVVRSRGRWGLGYAVTYQMSEYGWEEDTVAEMLSEMLLEEKAPGFQEAGSLEALQAWYKQHGAAYLARFK